jgi:lipopolysaccharide transport system permease protein
MNAVTSDSGGSSAVAELEQRAFGGLRRDLAGAPQDAMIPQMVVIRATTAAHPAPGHNPVQEQIIEAGYRDSRYMPELWRYRELFFFLAWRDILVRYKQTAVGIAWALIKAMVTLLVLTVVFERVAKLPSGGIPYPLLVFAAILPWQFFAGALTDCSNSLVNNVELISKVYFPRLIVPGSAMIVSLVDFAISCGVLALLLAWYGFAPDLRILALPLFTLLAVVLTFGASLWFAALTAQYRDFRFIVGLIAQLGLYISPVGFSSSVVPQEWRMLYSMNPLVGVIDGFRWAILRGATELYWPALAFSIAVAALLLASGLHYFRWTERRLADVI